MAGWVRGVGQDGIRRPSWCGPPPADLEQLAEHRHRAIRLFAKVTERTCDLLGDRYLFQERGVVQLKGKGKMLTYFLSGRPRKHDQMLDLTEPH
jgi:hypothetical protein